MSQIRRPGAGSTTPRGGSTTPRGGTRAPGQFNPLGMGQPQTQVQNSPPSTREGLLEEKSMFLANELACRDATIERLERENLTQLREISRIRREMQQKRDEEVQLITEELKQCHKELRALRQKQDAEVNRRVAEALARAGAAGGTAGATGKKPAAAAGKKNVVKTPAATPAVVADKEKVPKGDKIPLGKTPAPKSNVRKQGDKETVRGKKSGKYKGLGPQAPGEATALFDDGLAYRLEDGDSWSFYNDTPDYELHIDWEFGPQSRIRTEGDASASTNAEGWTVVNSIIYPDETKPFVTGSVNGWKSAYSLKPLSEEYRNKLTAAADAGVQKDMRAVEQLCSENGIDTRDDGAVLDVCKKNRTMFVDLNFRPGSRSISRPGQDEKLPVVPWQRPMQYLPPKLKETICLFNGIDPNDIDQGSLGDCWFLCAIASIAEFPDLVRAIYSPNGASDLPGQKAAYTLRLNKHGWFRDVIVDSFFPTTGGRPCFAQTCETPGEMWVALLEKAYAKLHGSYAAISGGYPLHALIDLTGFAGMNITPRMEESRKSSAAAQALFDDMCEWDSKDFMISVGTPGVDESDYNVGRQGGTDASMAAKYKEAGLVNGHAYSVLKVKSFPAHGLRLLQIRNPWGNSKEWTGEWGDDDPRWAQLPDVAAGCEFTDADDGTFWMPYRKFLEFFEDGQVVVRTKCRLDSRVKGHFSRGVPSTILKVTVQTPVDCMLTLSQKDPRGLAEGDPDKQKQAMLLTLARGEAGGALTNKLCSQSNPFKPAEERTFRYDRDQSMFVTLQPTGDGTGHYILPRIYEESVEKDYTLSIRVPPGAAHRGDINVEFVSFSSDASPFQNYATFSESDCGISSCQAECQALNRDTLVLKENKWQNGLGQTWQQVFEGNGSAPAAPVAAAPVVPEPSQQPANGFGGVGGGAYGGNYNSNPAANKYYDPNAMQEEDYGGGEYDEEQGEEEEGDWMDRARNRFSNW